MPPVGDVALSVTDLVGAVVERHVDVGDDGAVALVGRGGRVAEVVEGTVPSRVTWGHKR